MQVAFDAAPAAINNAKSGKTRIIAVAAPTRSPFLPDVPTTTEAGLPAFQASGWNALFAPRGTPQPIVQVLNAALRKALDEPATKNKLESIGAIPPRAENRTPDGLRAFVASEIQKWAPIMKAANVDAPR